MNDEQIRSRVMRIMSGVFNVEISKLNDDSSWNSIPGWDSTGQIDLIIALEREFGVVFSDEQSARLRSLGQVVRIVAEARAGGNP